MGQISKQTQMMAPVNILHDAIFKSVEMEIKNKLVTDPSTMHDNKAFRETMLNIFWWCWKNAFVHWRVGEREGKGWRIGWFSCGCSGRICSLKGACSKVCKLGRHLFAWPSSFGFISPIKELPTSCSINPSLHPNDSAFYLKKHTDDAELYILKIISTRLFTWTKEVSQSFPIAHLAMLQKNKIRIPYTKLAMKTILIPNGTSNYQHNGG